MKLEGILSYMHRLSVLTCVLTVKVEFVCHCLKFIG